MSYVSKKSLVLRKENNRFGWKEIKINKGDEFEVVDAQRLTNDMVYNIAFNGEKFSLNWLDAECLIQGDVILLDKCIKDIV